MIKRKSFTAEFKREAVRLLENSKKQPSDLARELGVGRNQLYKWKEQLSRRGEKAFPGCGRRIAGNDEVSRLRQELEQVKEERDILKKAAAYFAKELK
jgi:transposase-like protein